MACHAPRGYPAPPSAVHSVGPPPPSPQPARGNPDGTVGLVRRENERDSGSVRGRTQCGAERRDIVAGCCTPWEFLKRTDIAK